MAAAASDAGWGMRPRVLKLLENVRSSYWFVPTVMAIGALILGASIIYVDAEIGSEWLDGLGWYQSNKPDGAQEVLSTIAGSAITVAGVVFSITIVSVSFAASQYGPRVLSNFMADRGNQVTLGTFIATFLYCLIVLRTIRGGDEGDFVPDLAIIVALLLALCSIAVLIFFIHHVPRSIHVNSVVAGIGRQLIASLDVRFPEFIGRSGDSPGPDEAKVPACLRDGAPRPASDASPVRSAGTGYIDAIDDARLMEIASRSGLVLRLQYQPGDYIHAGRNFAWAWPREQATNEALEQLQGSFAVSTKRTALQDTRFLVDELVEVGTRALSPGVNDPFTAITCLDWLGAALSEAAPRRLPSPYRLDENGDLRVIALPMTFASYVERSLGQFRQYLATDKNACLHAFLTIERIAEACVTEEQVATLAAELEALCAAAGEALDGMLFEVVGKAAEATRGKLRSALHQGCGLE
ncbi:MAG: DUF2254 domain-containing protein [Allosphingosinicella sp.]